MRLGSISVLAIAALVVTGCVTYVAAPTPGASAGPTEPQTPAPTTQPTDPPTSPPTPVLTDPPSHPPTPTLAPGQTPPPTPLDLLPFLSSGINLYNLGDTTLFVTATGINTDSGEEFKLGEFQVEPEQFTLQSAIPLLIRFDFTFDEGSTAALATCTMNVASGDHIDFVAVNTGVAVTKNDVQPDTTAEMNSATSSLCATGAAQ
jgi:hypothetical protein